MCGNLYLFCGVVHLGFWIPYVFLGDEQSRVGSEHLLTFMDWYLNGYGAVGVPNILSVASTRCYGGSMIYKCRRCNQKFSSRFSFDQHKCNRKASYSGCICNTVVLSSAGVEYEIDPSPNMLDSFSGGGGDCGGGGARGEW